MGGVATLNAGFWILRVQENVFDLSFHNVYGLGSGRFPSIGMLMSRPREFDPHQVLDAALLAFWRAGYDGCSVSDLVEATGVQRQSLYNAYGDKRGLFDAVLARYRLRLAAGLEELKHPSAGLETLREYFEGVLATQRAHDVGACLLVKTAFTPQMEDPVLAAVVTEGAAQVRRAITKVLRQARARGELAPGIDPAATAAYLYTVVNGLSALSSTSARAPVRAVLTQAFAPLSARPKAPEAETNTEA